MMGPACSYTTCFERYHVSVLVSNTIDAKILLAEIIQVHLVLDIFSFCNDRAV